MSDVEEPPDWFKVADDLADAPDGAVLFLETYQAVYERCGMEWIRIAGDFSFSRPGVYIVGKLDGEEVDIDVPRCTSRKYEHGRVKCRCTLTAGHSGISIHDGGHYNLGAGRRW